MKKTGVGFRNMTLSPVRQAEIEDLALRFRNELKAEILKHRGSKAVGGVGSFVVNIAAHREVMMRGAEAMAKEKCQEFLQRVAAVLPVRSQINDDEISVAVHRALRDIIRNSAAWKEWNQNSPPTLQD